jgi:probable rRNA maturation factor
MSIELDLQLASTANDVPGFSKFEAWIQAALPEDKPYAEVSIRIVDADESQTLNAQYRGKDKPTNVLSFPFEQPPGLPVDAFEAMLGDMAICAPIVTAEAVEQKKPAEHHWAHMVVHGTLHLLGYDHINDDDAQEMESLERTILAKFNIPDPYQGENEV